MVNKTVIVKNAQGIHMRPAGILAAEMKKFPGCTVMLKTPDKTAKATAVMQIMAAGIKAGTAVEISADGENEQAALDKAVELFESGFGE
ncbi:HPr family phosphocarrier protein [Ruminococcus sp.]